MSVVVFFLDSYSSNQFWSYIQMLYDPYGEELVIYRSSPK